MTYDEITLFRRFLTDKGTFNNFEYLYRSHKFDNRDLNKFMEETKAEAVIMSAFDFSGAKNTIFNYQYWKKLDERWQLKLREFRSTGKIMEEACIQCANCKRILPKSAFLYRTNGLLHKHCKECESGEYSKRIKEIKTSQAVIEAQQREEQKKEIEKILDYAKIVSDNPIKYESKISINQSRNKMEDFTFFDFESKKGQGNMIGPNKFAVNNKKGNYSVVINADDSKTIIDGNLLRLRIRQDNITGALHFVFNATTGAVCIVRNNKNVTVSNKDLVEFLIDLLGYPKSTERVLVDMSENLSRTKDYVTFLIKKPKK